MIDHGYVQLALSSIVLPGSFAAFVKAHAAEVDELSGARKALVLAHAPVVEKKTRGLVAGRRRMAGLLNDGVKKTWFHLVDGTPAELRRLKGSENLHRGHGDDLAAARLEYLDETVAEVEQERAELPPDRPRKAGRPVTAKGEARQRAAVDLGTTPEALRKVEARAAAKAGGIEPPARAAEPPIELHGIEAPAEWLTAVAYLRTGLAGVDGKLRGLQALASLTVKPEAAHQAVKLALQEAGAKVRALIPHCACVFCRDPGEVHGRAPQCSACGGVGYLTAEQALRVPAEQLLPGAAPVVSSGRSPICGRCGGTECGPKCRYMDRPAGGWPAPKKPPARARGMQIEVDGKMVSARELTVEREPGADDGDQV